MVDKFHDGCPAPSTVQRAETMEKREADRVARDKAAAAADAAATSPEEAAAAEATAANAAADAPVAPDACHRCGVGENCCGVGGSWEGLCPGERSWDDGHTACQADMEKNGIDVGKALKKE